MVAKEEWGDRWREKELGLPRKAARAHLELDGTSRMYATQV